MKIISVINYKGGVGKTTLVANLASNLAFKGYKVLAIDLDPQSNLTFSFISVDEWKQKYQDSKTIKKWYDAFIEEDLDLDINQLIITPERVNNSLEGKLDLICSHLALINIDLELATRLGGASPRQSRLNYLKVHSRLKNGLNKLDKNDYDFVLIDCPPNFNIVTRNALVASDAFMVPAKPDYLSTLGIGQLQRHVKDLINDYNFYINQSSMASRDESEAIDPKMMGVVFTMVSIRLGSPISVQQDYIKQIQREDITTFDTLIRDNKTIYAGAPEYGVPVVIQKVSGETYTSVKNELEDVTNEFIEKTKNL